MERKECGEYHILHLNFRQIEVFALWHQKFAHMSTQLLNQIQMKKNITFIPRSSSTLIIKNETRNKFYCLHIHEFCCFHKSVLQCFSLFSQYLISCCKRKFSMCMTFSQTVCRFMPYYSSVKCLLEAMTCSQMQYL